MLLGISAAVALGWLMVCALGSVPFILAAGLDPINAWFETVSGFSGTGSSVIPDVESLPRGLLFWRSFTHWLGGMGFVALYIIDALILGPAWLFALDSTELSGPVNVVAPGLVTNGEFSRALGEALHRPAFLRVPAFALRLVVGQFAETLLGGQRALPRRLQGMGFRFIHPDLFGSLADIFSTHAGSRQTT